MLTNVERTLDLDVTMAQLDSYYIDNLLLQDAFPNLTPADREFIKTGITEDEWEEVFAGEQYYNLIGKDHESDD
jgi:hypothetical protein